MPERATWFLYPNICATMAFPWRRYGILKAASIPIYHIYHVTSSCVLLPGEQKHHNQYSASLKREMERHVMAEL